MLKQEIHNRRYVSIKDNWIVKYEVWNYILYI